MHEPGRILRVNQTWSRDYGKGERLLETPAWAVTVPIPDDCADYSERHEFEYVEFIDVEIPSECWAVHYGYDEFEIVPEDEVPDEVWAKLALLRLTGDAS